MSAVIVVVSDVLSEQTPAMLFIQHDDTIEQVASCQGAIRLPLGSGSVMVSPYLAITDLIGRWPQDANRHEIFLVSSGVDALQPRPNDSYLEEVTERAQRAGVQVYSIYADRAGHLRHTFWRSSWGQNNLSRLADGAEAYFQVMQMPISYRPYLDGFAERRKH